MGAVRTMRRRGLERERRGRVLKRTARYFQSEMRAWKRQALTLQEDVKMLQAALADPEGTVQTLLNERYSRDLRERELEHHASWDAEVVVHKMAAARWMRGCASAVAVIAGDLAIAAEIDRLPLVPSDG